MSSYTLESVRSQSGTIKLELEKRLQCRVEDLEIVKYPTGQLGVHWDAYCLSPTIIIPENWTIHSIEWSTQRLQMYAAPGDFDIDL